MANCLLLHPNRSDGSSGSSLGAILSGPAWTRPLANMQIRGFSKVAQSTSAAATATQFNVTMATENALLAIALIGHNMTASARMRITGWYGENSYASPDFQILQDVYPSLAFTEDLPWEAENWWDGKPLGEELEGFTQNALVVLPAGISCANWRVELFDEANPDGYVRISRLWMSGGWQPSVNYSYGGSIKYETATSVVESLSGREFFDRREPYRVTSIAFEYLDQQEALSKGLELCRRAGIDGEILYIADPADLRNITRTSFLGRLRQLSAWEQVVFERANIAFEIKELR